jgi:hypothetical protein
VSRDARVPFTGDLKTANNVKHVSRVLIIRSKQCCFLVLSGKAIAVVAIAVVAHSAASTQHMEEIILEGKKAQVLRGTDRSKPACPHTEAKHM